MTDKSYNSIMKENNAKPRKRRALKITLITLSVLIGLPLLTVGGYVAYVAGSYHRIGNQELTIAKASVVREVPVGEGLSVTSFNIGFGAYSDQYTFFMDEGFDEDGKKTVGHYGKGVSKEDVQKNTDGVLSGAKALQSDFYLLQEVDQESDRAYHINQREAFEKAFSDYESTYAVNFDSAYLFYPFHDPHGKSLAGLSTLSRYALKEASRQEYTISTSFSKFFDLDRCFAVHRLTVENGKEFVLVNSHMSAYDEGGKIRNTQIKELHSYIKAEADKGNYVVVGGDFNHDLLTNNPDYGYTQENFAYKDDIKQGRPEWLSYMFEEDGSSPFDDGFKVIASDEEPSCRDCDVPYTRGDTFVSTVDGFIVSENVRVESVHTAKLREDRPFAYSDHQPTTLRFSLVG